MAVKKKTDNEVVKAAAVDETENQAKKTNAAAIASTKEPAGDPGGFCVYIGPNIHGVIQTGTIFSGSRQETEAFLAPAIKKYPLIAKLLSPEKTFAEDRIKVKTAGNLLNEYYTQLASGKSN